jgi:SAM-dependent methyltransferase
MKVLHAGCGGAKLPPYWQNVQETRLDIDPSQKPDVVASITDMGEVGEFDAVYSSHCLEHLYPHDVPKALGEFCRVTKEGGVAVVIVPDLEDVKPTDDVLYESDSGPICGLDMYYGHGRLIEQRPYMAHHSGFVAKTLEGAMKSAGFRAVKVTRAGDYNLIGVGLK